MRIIDKLIPLLTISISTTVMAQLPFFLQRFRPKQGLLGSASSSYASILNPFSSSSILSPTYSSMASLLGAATNNLGSSLPFGYSSLGSSSLGSLGLGTNALTSSSFGSSFQPHNFGSSAFSQQSLGSASFSPQSLGSASFSPQSLGSALFSQQNLGSASFSPQSLGSASFSPQSLGSASFSPQGLGSLSFLPSNFGSSSGTASFTSSGGGSPVFSSSSFAPPSNTGYSPFASATFNSPSILGAASTGQKFEPSSFGSSDFGQSGSFDGLGGIDPIDLIDDYPGFSNAGFGKDLNFAGSEQVKFPASSTLGNDYNSYLKRSSNK